MHADWGAQDVGTGCGVHILCAHRVAQDMTAISCEIRTLGTLILCGAQDVAGCAQ